MCTPGVPTLTGHTAIVTGASSGLGQQAVRALHAAGATVVAVARRRSRLEALTESLDVRCVATVADLTEPAEIERVLEVASSLADPLDILVNVAGIADEQTALREGTARFRQVLEVNLVSVFDLSVAFAAQVRASQRGGAIVNVASIYGLRGSTGVPGAGYAASKAGVLGLTRELAAQWSRYGIRVNALAPGFFPTEMTASLLDAGSEARQVIEQRTLLGRLGELHELDGPLLLLASPASSYVTGQVLAVDGGWTAV
jgi:NAD(P)-dependent dehydrogenase (short-subunit alcohol dehydrogenase family)